MPGRMTRAAAALSGRPGTKWFLIALATYTIATFIMTYPVPLRVGSVIAGLDRESADYRQYTWWLWWGKHAFLDPDLRFTQLALTNHPVGAYQPLILTMIGVNLAALPFSLLFAPATTYNIQALLSFVLAGLAMYFLASELTGDRRAGLVGGFIFAFFPNKTGHVLAGHLPQITVYWFPLYALFLLRALRKPSWTNTLLLAVTLTASCLIHVMHIVYLLLPVTLVVFLLVWRDLGKNILNRRRVLMLSAGFLVAGLAVAPFLVPTLRLAIQDGAYLYKAGVVKSSTDALAFFTPSPFHPVLDRLGLVPQFAKRVFESEEALREGLAYPGIAAAGLALYAVIHRRRETSVWAIAALAAAVLSLGPFLKVGEQLVTYRADAYEGFLVLPYALLRKLPFLQVGRTPGRLNEATMFAVAVLASYGVAELARRASARSRRLLPPLLALLLFWIGFEYIVVWPFPSVSAEIPSTIQAMAGSGEAGALLHLPATRSVNHKSLYYQTAARRPIVGGNIHRTPPEVVPWMTTLRDLVAPDEPRGDAVPRPGPADRLAWLRHFDVDNVVVHTSDPNGGAESRRAAEDLLGPAETEDAALAVFRVPADAPEPEGEFLYTFDGGWHAPELDGHVWRRWLFDDAYLYVYSKGDEVGGLQMTIDSPQQLPIMDVYLGDNLIESILVAGRTEFTTRPVTLTEGMTVFSFRARGGCSPVVDDARCWSEALESSPPDELSVTCDPRAVHSTCRSFVVDRVTVVPESKLQVGQGVDIALGDTIRLRNWRLGSPVLHAGGTLTVTLGWEPIVALSDRYVVFVHLVDRDGKLVAQDDAAPVGTLLPASAWTVGTTLTYDVVLDLPMHTVPGEYLVFTGVYVWPSLERLSVPSIVAGSETNVVHLGSVRVAE